MPGAGGVAAGDGFREGSTGKGGRAQAGLCQPYPIPRYEARPGEIRHQAKSRSQLGLVALINPWCQPLFLLMSFICSLINIQREARALTESRPKNPWQRNQEPCKELQMP